MNLEITGKKIDITPAIRQYVEEQLQKAEKFLPKVNEVQLVLTVQKYRHIAELVIHVDHGQLTSVEETDDLYAAINLCFDKIIKQARRRRKKIIGLSRKKKSKAREFFSQEIDSEPNDNPEIIPHTRFSLKPMDVDEASMKLGMSNDIFLVFRNADTEKINVIYKRKDGNHGLVEPEK